MGFDSIVYNEFNDHIVLLMHNFISNIKTSCFLKKKEMCLFVCIYLLIYCLTIQLFHLNNLKLFDRSKPLESLHNSTIQIKSIYLFPVLLRILDESNLKAINSLLNT